METINLMGKNVPVMGDTLGVVVSAKEVISGSLLNRFDVFVTSWDGIYQVVSIDAAYRAVVKTVGGMQHSVYLNEERHLAAFFKAA